MLVTVVWSCSTKHWLDFGVSKVANTVSKHLESVPAPTITVLRSPRFIYALPV